LKELLLAERHGLELDYEAELFLLLFSSTPKRNVGWRDGRMVWLRSNTMPPIIHYNGGIAGDEHGRGMYDWMNGYRAADLIHHLKMIPVPKDRVRLSRVWGHSPSGNQSLADAADRLGSKIFSFVTPQLHAKRVPLSTMCLLPVR
jgi:hypothetical protein